jgi:ABC-type tungstate transport system substrate-binding protein
MAGITIKRLALRVHGLSEAEAHSLAREVADRLARAPAAGAARQVASLGVTLRLGGAQSPAGLAGRIADEIMLRLARERG